MPIRRPSFKFKLCLAIQQRDQRTIKPINSFDTDSYGATTCIRIAFKAFEMKQFRFSWEGVDPTKGTLANSQKKKYDELKEWVDSPYHQYKVTKRGNHCVVSKKHAKITCADEKCTTRANTKCSHKMCKKCCIKHTSAGADKCKLKEHKEAVLAEESNDDVEVDAEESSGEMEADEGDDCSQMDEESD